MQAEEVHIQHASVKRYKSLWPILKVVLCFNLGSVYFGYSLVYFNAIKYEEVERIFSIQLDSGFGEGLYSGIIEFGAIFGALASRFILKFCSRKQSFYMANMIAFVSVLIVLFGEMKSLLIGRMLQGSAVGIFSTIIPLTVREYVPVQISGFMGSFLAPSIVFGTFLAYFIHYIASLRYKTEEYWQTVFGFPLAIIILQQFFLMTIYKDQTPKYLIRSGKLEQAKQFIKQMYEEQYCDQVLKEKMAELKISKLKSTKLQEKHSHTIVVEVEKKEVQNLERVNSEGGMSELSESQQDAMFWDEDTTAKYPKDIRRALFLAFWMEIFQNLAGIYIITLYGRELAEYAMPDLQHILPVLLNMWRLFMSFFAIVLIKKYGRKRILLPGVIVMSIGLFGLFLGFINHTHSEDNEWFLFVCLLIMITTFTISIAPVTWLYIPEIVQPPLIPFTTIINWISACLIIILFPYLKEKSENKDTPGLFLFLSLCMVAHAIVLRIFMRETRYKRQSSIRQSYKQPISNWRLRRWFE